jgi:hypothetical protein
MMMMIDEILNILKHAVKCSLLRKFIAPMQCSYCSMETKNYLVDVDDGFLLRYAESVSFLLNNKCLSFVCQHNSCPRHKQANLSYSHAMRIE